MKFKILKKLSSLTLTTILAVASVYTYNFPSIVYASDISSTVSEAENVKGYITLSDKGSSVKGSGAAVNQRTITIVEGGIFYVTGSISNGQIILDSDSDVELVLNGVSLTSLDGPCIYGKNGDISIKALKDTVNTLNDSQVYSSLDENSEPDACVFSHDKITLKGNGTLNINANYGDAIASKDELKINDSILNIKAADNGIRGKSYLEINSGTITVESESDAIKSSGSAILNGGSLTLTSGKKGFDIQDELTINDGSINILSCTEGYEATKIIINGGSSNITASDDGINAADGSSSSKGGFGEGMRNRDFNGDRNFDENSDISDMRDLKKPAHLNMQNGEKPIDANMQNNKRSTADNTQNGEKPIDANIRNNKRPTADNTQNAEAPISPQNNNFSDPTANANCSLEINGGYIYINADGDGIDSNGSITINDGIVIVNGPTNNGNGIFDSGTGITYNRGTVLAVGSSGMLETPDATSSKGYTLSYTGEIIPAKTLITITDESGNVLAALKPAKDISSIIFSSPLLKEGMNVNLYKEGTYNGTLSADDYATGGTLSDGILIEKLTISDNLTSAGTFKKAIFSSSTYGIAILAVALTAIIILFKIPYKSIKK